MTSVDMFELEVRALRPRWWTLLIRGIAAILFGVITFLMPSISVVALVFLWGAYAFVDGVFNLILGFQRASAHARQWGWLLFEGAVSILAGVAAVIWPGLTAYALLMLIAFWAVVTGIAEIAAAIRLRKLFEGEWLMALSGALSIAFGLLLFFYPTSGALGLLWLIGGYAIVFGALLVGLSFRVGFGHERHAPLTGAPTPA